ncbi:MAG: hypothetical protein IKY33_03920, partial [Clostridia bacterium]|nr:hypothetical protein [Clostridia bacterium]
MNCPILCGQYKNTPMVGKLNFKQQTDIAFRVVSVLFLVGCVGGRLPYILRLSSFPFGEREKIPH